MVMEDFNDVFQEKCLVPTSFGLTKHWGTESMLTIERISFEQLYSHEAKQKEYNVLHGVYWVHKLSGQLSMDLFFMYIG